MLATTTNVLQKCNKISSFDGLPLDRLRRVSWAWGKFVNSLCLHDVPHNIQNGGKERFELLAARSIVADSTAYRELYGIISHRAVDGSRPVVR